MSRFAGLRKHLPLRSALSLYLKIKTGQFQNLSVPFLPFPFSIRNNPFDYAVFEEVLLKKAYEATGRNPDAANFTSKEAKDLRGLPAWQMENWRAPS